MNVTYEKKNAMTFIGYCESLCPICPCAMKKHIQTCGSCAEMGTCEKLAAIIGNNPDAIRNLKG